MAKNKGMQAATLDQVRVGLQTIRSLSEKSAANIALMLAFAQCVGNNDPDERERSLVSNASAIRERLFMCIADVPSRVDGAFEETEELGRACVIIAVECCKIIKQELDDGIVRGELAIASMSESLKRGDYK